MNNPTIGDMIRHVVGKVFESGEAQRVPLASMALALEGKKRTDVTQDELDTLISALKSKMTQSYINMTVNRMKDVIAANKKSTAKFVVDDDYGDIVVIIGLKDGTPRHISKAEREEHHQMQLKGAKKLAKAIQGFSPNIMDISPENVEAVQGVVKQYREHADKLISQMAGVEDDQD